MLLLLVHCVPRSIIPAPACLPPPAPPPHNTPRAVVHYQKGQFYAEHYDNKAGSNITRAATIIIYLCDTQAGGATYFPRCLTTGLRGVGPVQLPWPAAPRCRPTPVWAPA
jgi:hypothetical protein